MKISTWKINNFSYCHCCNELETLEHCFINYIGI